VQEATAGRLAVPAAETEYRAAAWVRLLRAAGIPVAATLMVAGAAVLVVAGRPQLALLGLLVGGVGIGLMSLLPRHLEPINHHRTRDLAAVEKETAPIFAYALLHPILVAPAAAVALLLPIPLLPGFSRSPLLSVTWVLGSKVVLLLLPTLIAATAFGHPLRQLGLRAVPGGWRWIGPVIPSLLICAGLAAIVGPTAHAVPPQILVALAVIALIHAGFPEEAFYRGLLQTRLELLLGSHSGIGVTAVLFGLRHVARLYAFTYAGSTGHVTGDLAIAFGSALAYQGAIGVFFGYMWMRYRNIWVNVGVHTAFDFLAFAALITG
jgi:membrane protease YdiL (CAAX protease family)